MPLEGIITRLETIPPPHSQGQLFLLDQQAAGMLAALAHML